MGTAECSPPAPPRPLPYSPGRARSWAATARWRLRAEEAWRPLLGRRGRLLQGNNAAPPGVALRRAGRRTPERGQSTERAGKRAGAGRPPREPWARRREGPELGATQRRGGAGRGPGAAASRHRGRGAGDEGARRGDPVCAPRRRPAQRASLSRQTRGRRSGGAPPPGPQNVKRGGGDAETAGPGALAALRLPRCSFSERRGRATPRAVAGAVRPPCPAPPPRSERASALSELVAPTREEPRLGLCVWPLPRLLALTSLNNDHSQPRWEDNGQKMPGHSETLPVKFSPGWRGGGSFPRGGAWWR